MMLPNKPTPLPTIFCVPSTLTHTHSPCRVEVIENVVLHCQFEVREVMTHPPEEETHPLTHADTPLTYADTERLFT